MIARGRRHVTEWRGIRIAGEPSHACSPMGNNRESVKRQRAGEQKRIDYHQHLARRHRKESICGKRAHHAAPVAANAANCFAVPFCRSVSMSEHLLKCRACRCRACAIRTHNRHRKRRCNPAIEDEPAATAWLRVNDRRATRRDLVSARRRRAMRCLQT